MLFFEARAGLPVLRLEHGKANALDLELCHGLSQALEAHKDVAALVLTGTGRIFSAGVDLRRLLSEGAAYIKPFLSALDELLERLFLFPRPLVAAINGHAIAGGAVIACAADYRVLARGNARMGVPELRVGVPFPDLALEIVRSAVARSHFRSIVLRGETYEPEAALTRGLVDELVTESEVLDTAARVANELALIPKRVFAHSKMQVRRGSIEHLRRLSAAERENIVQLWCDPETLFAVDRYVKATLKPGGAKS